MKLCKYYSLDECHEKDLIFGKLNHLQDDSKVEFLYIKGDDVIKLKNIRMSIKEKKDLLLFFKENDIIDYPDYEEYYDEFDDNEEEEDDEEYEY